MFGFLIAIGGLLAGLFQTGIDAVVTALVWAVGALEAGAIALWNGIKGALNLARVGFVKVWDFFRPIYDDVLKPAWQKFWTWFDRLRTWWTDTFGPVLRWLQELRKTLLDFWATYVRPWLDLIDVTRKLLRTLGSLGLAWAKALDQRLGAIENAIEAPFRFVLGKLNEIINVVNTIVTADGLFQRLALIRSIGRDYQFVWRAIAAPYTRDVTDNDRQQLADGLKLKELPAITNETREYLRDRGGPLGPLLDEMTVIWRKQLRES